MIYNYVELWGELQLTALESVWRSPPDAETLIAAVECWEVTMNYRKNMLGSPYKNFTKNLSPRFNKKHGST